MFQKEMQLAGKSFCIAGGNSSVAEKQLTRVAYRFEKSATRKKAEWGRP
jgi:hypothetical protein